MKEAYVFCIRPCIYNLLFNSLFKSLMRSDKDSYLRPLSFILFHLCSIVSFIESLSKIKCQQTFEWLGMFSLLPSFTSGLKFSSRMKRIIPYRTLCPPFFLLFPFTLPCENFILLDGQRLFMMFTNKSLLVSAM